VISLLRRSLLLVTAGFFLSRAVLGQDSNAAIEQSRLFQNSLPTTGSNVTPDGTALPDGDNTTSSDDSFGAQQILKAQEKVPQFLVSGDASVFYTSNVALTRRDTIADKFFVGDAGLAWTPRINNEFQLQMGARASIFRYDDTSELDFESLGAGVGLLWTPHNCYGIGFVARYDFTELLDRHSNELLEDHELSLAAQKIFALGRSHAVSFGLVGSAGISDPFAEQRDQIGAVIGYHLQWARCFDSDLSYKHSWYFYNSGGRTDFNQILALGLHYHLTRWATVDGFVSGAINDSNRSVFKYNVFTAGGGVGLGIRF
jgi:hypothetical protein